MTLFDVILRRFPLAVPLRDFALADHSDGAGPFIAKWDATALGPQPTPDELAALIANPPPAPPAPMPWAISNADLRRGLIVLGVNPALITGYLTALAEGASKWSAIADWEYANYFERTHPMLNALAPAFGLTATDVDNIFRAYPAYPRPSGP